MSKSTRKRSFLASALVLVASLFATGAADKETWKPSNDGKPQYSSGMGRNTGAIFTPKRTKFKGHMRDKSSFNKNR